MRSLEELHGALVLLGALPCVECSQVFALTGFRIRLAGIKAEFPGFEFSNHN